MVNTFRWAPTAALAVTLAVPTLANAQDIFLATGGADLTWHGTATGAKAGIWMDIGAVSNDTRRDLIVGAPGTSGTSGTVYVIFGGPDRTGDRSLSLADTVITSSAAGNRFGASTAAGNIRNTEGTTPRNLVVGAPGALSDRGAVYLFSGGFASGGAALSTANAVYTILGAPADQLGTALATGDLDGDGFREIIIGAPGTSRIYIIKGGTANLPSGGTLDLSGGLPACSANADVNCFIQAGGIGRTLIAGDVTGDGVYDLLVGSPSCAPDADLAAKGCVFLYPGSAGKLPFLAPTAFLGIDAGDEAGTFIRILDIDDDGKNDVAITAPGGDGPGNGRANAGEVYVFLGPIAITNPPSALRLSAANIVFYGAAAGNRAGDTLATGDINRDTPNDLVINESGGSGRRRDPGHLLRPQPQHHRHGRRQPARRRPLGCRTGQSPHPWRCGYRFDRRRAGVRGHRRRRARHHRRRARLRQQHRQAVFHDLAEAPRLAHGRVADGQPGQRP